MYRVCALRLAPTFGVWPTTDNKFFLRLTDEKMGTFPVSTKNYLRPYGCNGTYFTATVNCTNQKTKIQREIIEIEIIEIQV